MAIKQKIDFETVKRRISEMDLAKTDMVIGIAEGGMPPAKLISEKLGCGLCRVKFSYRNDDNVPIHTVPLLLEEPVLKEGIADILIVDDVSVSGRTLKSACALFAEYNVRTLVLIGTADHVVFPEIRSCVTWPWKKGNNDAGE